MKKLQTIISDVADRVETAVQRHLPELQQHLPQHLFDSIIYSANDSATLQRRVPRSLDLTYMTSRIIVMSAPAEGLYASRSDNGRETLPKRSEVAQSIGDPDRNTGVHPETEQSISIDAFGPIEMSKNAHEQNPQEHNRPQAPISSSKLQNESSKTFQRVYPLEPADLMPDQCMPLVDCFCETDENDEPTAIVAQKLPQHETLEASLDGTLPQHTTPDGAKSIQKSTMPQEKAMYSTPGKKEKYLNQSMNNIGYLLKGNNPSTLSTFLHQYHANHFLAVNLTNSTANDRTLILLRRQVANLHWSSPHIEKSETPTLSHVLEVVYVMYAYIHLNPTKNTVVVYCQNGKTRSAIILACYLKFIRSFRTSLEGFEYFLGRRCASIAKAAVSQLPPSLHQLFINFDAMVDRMDYGNRKPLLLRAIALQGVPVEDQPCLDIFCQNELVYSSNVEMDSCHWADEEGIYRISKMIEGDFMVIVRFGGEYSSDCHDFSKVLFRYCNTTGFCTSGPLELPKSKVDMMRRYAGSFDEGDFILTLLLESYWDGHGNNSAEFSQDSTVLVEVMEGNAAVERGLFILTGRHAAAANKEDISRLRYTLSALLDCPDTLCRLALQLSDHDLKLASKLLTQGTLGEWWIHSDVDEEKEDMDWPNEDEVPRPITPELTCVDILKILDNDDIGFSHYSSSPPRKRMRPVEETPLVYETIHFPYQGDIESLLPLRMGHKNDYDRDSLLIKPRLPFKRHSTRIMEASKKADQADHQASMELLLQINHTGVLLEDLLQLQLKARAMSLPPIAVSENVLVAAVEEEVVDDVKDVVSEVDNDGDEDDGKLDDEQHANSQFLGMVDSEAKDTNDHKEAEMEEDKGLGENPPLNQDPLYQKYFKMVSMGMSVEVAKHAMQRDSLDPSIMDLDPARSLKDQLSPVNLEGLPLADDPEFMKYFKMLKMGMPVEMAKHAMKRDGKDDSILDLDPSKSLKSQIKAHDEGVFPQIALEDDPEYGKYFKMLKMGLPHDAVKHSLQRDGKDPNILDMDPKKSLASQTTSDDGPLLRDDPEYEKYFKMIKMGLPLGAVKNGLVRDGKDPAIMDLDPNKSLKSQLGGKKEDDGPPLKEDEVYSKYFKMLKMGLPIGAVKNAITRDGKDPSVIDLNPEKSLKSQQGDGDRDEPPMEDTGTPLRDDPEFSKYFKMMKMGLPSGAVKNAISRDGKDPSILDLDPEKSLDFQLAQKKCGRGAIGTSTVRLGVKKKKKKVRRKKIYWTPIDASKLHDESLWSLVKGSVTMESLKFDVTEFEYLFTESANPADNKKQVTNGGGDGKAKQKKSTQVIDGKRGMNGGIILARLKIKYEKIAEMVDTMTAGDFDSTQLKALKEFLPTDEDRTNLKAYLKQGEASEKAMAQAMADLSECEKYMVAMMKVDNPVSKFDAMVFKFNFNGRMEELEQGIVTVKKACDEVRSSERLRKLMAMILTLVNHINTGGDGNLAAGFSLDALLKLNEAKAFDKKTSVLEYLVKLVRENDMSLLDFKLDIETVPMAQNIVLDGLLSDVKVLRDELQLVHETVKTEVNRLDEEGKLVEITLADFGEERTMNREIDGTPHFDKVDQNSGRTPMERFTLAAQSDVDKSLAELDELKENYSNVLKYFGEDDKMASNDFFGTLQKFVLEFKVAAEKVDAVERQRVSRYDQMHFKLFLAIILSLSACSYSFQFF